MATSKSKKSNQKYLIVAVGLALATAGYFGYKSMLTSPDINKIAPPERPRPTKIPRKHPTQLQDLHKKLLLELFTKLHLQVRRLH